MMIVHRCADCHHPDVWAASQADSVTGWPRNGQSVTGKDGRQRCESGERCHPDQPCTWGAPELMRRFTDAGQLVEGICPPGGNTSGAALGAIRSCCCDACKTFYAQQAG